MQKSLTTSLLVITVIVNAVFPAGLASASFLIQTYGDPSFGGSSASFGSPSFQSQTNVGTPSFDSGYNGTPSFGSASFGAPSFTGGTNPAVGSPSFGTGNPNPTFGSASFGTPTFTGGTTPSFGGTTVATFGTPTFGTGSGNPNFGTPTFGTPTFTGGTTPTFGTPTFGNPTFGTPTFGTPTFTGGTTPTFGNPTFGTPIVTDACHPYASTPSVDVCDFTITISPSSQNVTKPGTASYTVSVSRVSYSTRSNGGLVRLSFSTDDNAITGSFNQTSVAIGGSTTLNVFANQNAINGYHLIRVSGSNTTNTRYATAALNVNQTTPPPVGSAPYAQTNPASSVGQNSATLNGTVDPNGGTTSYWFEYGTNYSLGNNTQTFSAGSGNNGNPVSAGISGLSANTTYYFRAVAQNQYGTSQGSILSFTTNSNVQYQPTLVVTPSYATINSGAIQSFQAIYDADGSNGPQASQTVTNIANWSSNNQAVALQIGNGQFQASAAGSALVTAMYAGLTATATLNVQNNNPAGNVPSVQTNAATGVAQNGATLNGTVNPNGGATSYWFEYGTNYNLGQSTGFQSAGSGNNIFSISSGISGLTQNTTYYFRAVAQNQYGTTRGSILSFVTGQAQQGNAPIVQTNAATGVSQNGATINGTVDPNGSATSYWFEYGTNYSLGQNTGAQSIGSTYGTQAVFANISNLQTNTTYYFRVVAQNQFGTTQGSILSFVVGGGSYGNAPSVQTNPATGVSQNGATLNGNVNSNGNNTSYWFEYGTSYNLGQSTGFQSAGSNNSNFSISSGVYNLSANTTYYFRAVAQNQYGTSYGSILSFVTSGGSFFGGSAPYAQTNSATNVGQTYATFNGYVTPNNADTYAWYEYGISPNSLSYTTNSNYIGAGSGNIPLAQNVTNLSGGNTTYYFRIVARNNNGTSYGSVLSFNTIGGGNYNGNQPIVNTRPATFVYRTSAVLVGDVNPQGGITTAWFEYGPSTSLGLRTNQQPMGNGLVSQGFVYALSSLLPNATYYFRAVAQNQYGTAYGQLQSFQTTRTPIVVTEPPVVYVNPTPVAGTPIECVILTPTASSATVNAGQDFFYTITYRNTCTYALKNAVLRVQLPQEVEFISSDNPFYVREANNGLIYNLGTVPANAQVTITIHARVSDTVESGDTLLTNTNLSFQDPKNNFRVVNGLLTLTVGEGHSLLASLIDVLGRLFGACWFWFIVIFLLFLLALLIMYRLMLGRREEIRRVDIMTHSS